MNIDQIKQVFKDNGVSLDKDDAWQVQKVWVMKHKALERLSAAIKVKWHEPKILRCEADEAVILVMGSRADKPEVMEWSVGEAKIVFMVPTGKKNQWGKDEVAPAEGSFGNYQITPKQASYVWAMAEKRAKDRVIIKLAGLHGAYSEEEADEFKGKGDLSVNGEAANDETSKTAPKVEKVAKPAAEATQEKPADAPLSYDDIVTFEKFIDGKLEGATEAQQVADLMLHEKVQAVLTKMKKEPRDKIRNRAKARMDQLKPAA